MKCLICRRSIKAGERYCDSVCKGKAGNAKRTFNKNKRMNEQARHERTQRMLTAFVALNHAS